MSTAAPGPSVSYPFPPQHRHFGDGAGSVWPQPCVTLFVVLMAVLLVSVPLSFPL